jgi:hypothetical protein
MNLDEFRWIHVNYKYDIFKLYTHEFICIKRICSMRPCKWCTQQCVAVRLVVCAQCAWHECAAVFLVVYCSAHGTVRLSGSAAVCGSAQQPGSACAAVRQCAAVRTAVCDSALYVYIYIVALMRNIYIGSQSLLVYPYRGDKNEPRRCFLHTNTNNRSSVRIKINWHVNVVWINYLNDKF